MIMYLAGNVGHEKTMYPIFSYIGGDLMRLYLAGGISGNLKPHWSELVTEGRKGNLRIFLAGTNGRRWCVDAILKEAFQLAELDGRQYVNIPAGTKIDIAILESFYYIDDWIKAIIPYLKHFLLDSGAFTFFTSGKKVDWDDYVDRYAEFIKEFDVKDFFELDIDPLVGYKRVLELRERLETKAERPCIPVWHKSRGKAEFLKMCDAYDYVAIGGIVSKEIKPPEYKYFPWFIEQAHRRGAKIHGLGFTNLEGMVKYHFDSVDSTSWTTGNRFGAIYQFDGRTMRKHGKPDGMRLSDARTAAVHNFNEWVKFQKYAERYL